VRRTLEVTVPEPTPTRRQRARERTERELKEAALAEVRERGATAVTLRGVARRVGMSPAGLYRYVDSRDALLTWLIADGYDAYADHLEAALAGPGSDDVAARLVAVAMAYRSWAVRNPNAFGLLFGEPIPGYAAPADGPTTAAMSRLGAALATPLLEAHARGLLRVPEPMTAEALEPAMAPMAELAGELPHGVYVLLLLSWGRLHGQVSLEVFGHHAWLLPDGCEPLYRAEVETLAAQLLGDG
jgi:AcrR family transcriptional regulator